MLEQGSSDFFITAGCPPSIKIKGIMTPLSKPSLSAEDAMKTSGTKGMQIFDDALLSL
jgi:twitching motility protein PilU